MGNICTFVNCALSPKAKGGHGLIDLERGLMPWALGYPHWEIFMMGVSPAFINVSTTNDITSA